MKLFSLPDGTIDRKDRAQWLTCPFDLDLRSAIPTQPDDSWTAQGTGRVFIGQQTGRAFVAQPTGRVWIGEDG